MTLAMNVINADKHAKNWLKTGSRVNLPSSFVHDYPTFGKPLIDVMTGHEKAACMSQIAVDLFREDFPSIPKLSGDRTTYASLMTYVCMMVQAKFGEQSVVWIDGARCIANRHEVIDYAQTVLSITLDRILNRMPR